jgi:hypothetical protein
MTLVNPIQHPDKIVKGQWPLEPCQETYLRRLGKLVKDELPMPETDITKPPPNSILFPTLGDLEEFIKPLEKGEFDAVSIDIENAGPHIICIGFTQLWLEHGTVGTSLCLRFRRRGGGLYWKTRRELRAAVAWLFVLLSMDSIAKVFHNGVVYDVPILQRLGFKVRGRLIDTINLQHACYPEMPKSLQFCSTLYLWSGCWKRLTDVEDEGDGKG